MRFAAFAAFALAACHPPDPKYRKELDRVCAAPRVVNAGLRLRSAEGQALSKALDDAPAEQRPMVLLRAAKRGGLEHCGDAPTKLASLARVPAVDWRAEPQLERYHDAAMILDPSLAWRSARAELPDDARILVANGVELDTLALPVEVPPREPDLGLTAAISRDAMTIYATADRDVEGSARLPRLRLPLPVDEQGREVIGRVLADVAAASDDRIRYSDPSLPFTRIRWIADDDVRLGTIVAAVSTLSREDRDHVPMPIVRGLGAEAVVAVPPVPGVRLVSVMESLVDVAPPALANRVVHDYLPALIACYPAQAAAAGTLELHAVVLVNGTMRGDPTVRTFGLPDVDACVEHASLAWKFDPQPEATELIVRLAMGV